MVYVNVDDEKKKSLIFSERKTTVHISKSSGLWINGIILEVGNDFFIIKDRLNGKESLVLFSELDNPIEIYKEKEEVTNG
jgi:hypothetical protein